MRFARFLCRLHNVRLLHSHVSMRVSGSERILPMESSQPCLVVTVVVFFFFFFVASVFHFGWQKLRCVRDARCTVRLGCVSVFSILFFYLSRRLPTHWPSWHRLLLFVNAACSRPVGLLPPSFHAFLSSAMHSCASCFAQLLVARLMFCRSLVCCGAFASACVLPSAGSLSLLSCLSKPLFSPARSAACALRLQSSLRFMSFGASGDPLSFDLFSSLCFWHSLVLALQLCLISSIPLPGGCNKGFVGGRCAQKAVA